MCRIAISWFLVQYMFFIHEGFEMFQVWYNDFMFLRPIHVKLIKIVPDTDEIGALFNISDDLLKITMIRRQCE